MGRRPSRWFCAPLGEFEVAGWGRPRSLVEGGVFRYPPCAMRRHGFALAAVSVLLSLVSTRLEAQPKAQSPLSSGLSALAKSDYTTAEAELARVSGAAVPDAKLGLAQAAFEQGKFGEAEKQALAAASSAAHRTRAMTVRAQVLRATGRIREAIKLLEVVSAGSGTDSRRVRLLLGEYLLDVGKRADAEILLHKVIDEYNDGTITAQDAEGLAHVGRAAFLLRSPKDANAAFKESERADKTRVETHLWAAELFLDKYDSGHAEEELNEALAESKNRADILVALARVKLDQNLDFDGAETLIKRALEINPKHAGALAVRAGLSLRDMDIAAADKYVAEGLSVNPSDLELLSMKAAARFLDDDLRGFETVKKTVFASNPEYARVYSIVGEYAEWEHRYDDIVGMMKEATRIDPDDGKAWAALGLTQMRGGDETAGLESVRKAWGKDKFNVRVFNTLNLYEQELANQYELVSDGIFKIRYAKDEKAVLERYVPRMLGEAFASMKARYGHVPTVPVQVELYSSRQSFSVRTSGLPNIGIQGVCFGRVIAAVSPKAEPFNYGNVLWHELGHVFAIQMSKNRVPRWFTEGLSEYETIARRPSWARELDAELYQAIRKGKLPGAVNMNRAFTHAGSANDVSVAYYAASQMLLWTVEKFGMAKVSAALQLWGQGKKTPDVIQRAFGMTAAEYDAGYRAWELARLSRYENQYLFSLSGKSVDDARKGVERSPSDASAHVELSVALLRANKGKEAKAEIDAALTIDPKSPDAHFVAAQLARGAKDFGEAKRHLETMRSLGHDGFVIHAMLADLAEARKDEATMRFHLEAAHRLDPSQSEPIKGLLDLAIRSKREGEVLPLLEKLAQLEQHDRKVWRMLLEKLVAAKRWEDARRVGESAIFVDVLGAETHVLYARALSARQAHEKAIFELETALLCAAKPKEKATAHALLAEEFLAIKRPADAKVHLQHAVRLDPENEAAKRLTVP